MSRAAAVLLALSALSALAGKSFEPVPAEEKGKPSPLAIRIVGYDGNTNGALTVEVKNPSDAPARFDAKGLYFVPAVDPDKAPQRLGAVGTTAVRGERGWQRHDAITLAPGQTIRAQLDVYCIDSHRPSPTSETPFRVAKDRIPPKLVRAIEADAHKAAEAHGGVASPRAKPAVQKEVWKNRDAQWLELDGEGPQEAAKKR